MNVKYKAKCHHSEYSGECATHAGFVLQLLAIVSFRCDDTVVTATCGERTFVLGPSVNTPECDELEAMLAFFAEVDTIEAQPQN